MGSVRYRDGDPPTLVVCTGHGSDASRHKRGQRSTREVRPPNIHSAMHHAKVHWVGTSSMLLAAQRDWRQCLHASGGAPPRLPHAAQLGSGLSVAACRASLEVNGCKMFLTARMELSVRITL